MFKANEILKLLVATVRVVDWFGSESWKSEKVTYFDRGSVLDYSLDVIPATTETVSGNVGGSCRGYGLLGSFSS